MQTGNLRSSHSESIGVGSKNLEIILRQELRPKFYVFLHFLHLFQIKF